MRTGLDQDWLASVSFALVHFSRGHENEIEALVLVDGVISKARELGHPPVPALADLAEEIGRYVHSAMGQYTTGLEFRDLDTGATVDPAVFQTTKEGQTSVWASRVIAAALGGDLTMVATLVEARAAMGSEAIMLVGLAPLLSAAATIVAERPEGYMIVAGRLLPASHIDYTARCRDCPACWAHEERWRRDHSAAGHISRTGHTVTLGEE